MGFDYVLPDFVGAHLNRIAKAEGFAEGYDVKHESGSKVGDGFNASILSIKLIGYRNLVLEELALICKLQPGNVDRQGSFGSAAIFRQEVSMYKDLLPCLISFQEKHGVPKEVTFTGFPKYYSAFYEDESSSSVILMEDLRAAGFEMWDKKMPTNFEIVRLVMEQMGRLHGLSMTFRDQKPELFQNFQQMATNIIDFFAAPGVKMIIQSSFKQSISMMTNNQDVEAIERLAKNFKQIYLDGLDANLLGNYGVLSHGDCWINNMMFAFEKGLPKSVTFLDWQLSRLTSPAVDLSYFLLSCVEKPLRDAYLDDFLQIYYTNLAQIIRSAGSDPDKIFPEAELYRQLRQFSIYGVAMAHLLIPLILANGSEETLNVDDLTDLLADGEGEMKIIRNISDAKMKVYCQRIKDVMADARQYGWLS